MTDIPDWAGKRACELLNAENPHFEWRWKQHGFQCAVRTVAKLVMQHETKPADPDEEAVKRIFQHGWDMHQGASDHYWSAYPGRLAAAVAQYKKERGNG